MNREVICNEMLGTLMRTKASHNNEGGVNAGFAVIDTPFVVSAAAFNAPQENNANVKGTV